MTNLDKARDARIGFDGYCTVLASLARGPRTSAQLADRMGIWPRTMSWICCSMFKAGLIHRSAWVKAGPRQKHLPVWAWGKEGDVPHPHWRPVKRKSASAVLLLGSIRDALELGPLDSGQLAQDIGFTRPHMLWVLRKLKAHRLIRVAAWDVRAAGNHVALIAFGQGVDVKPLLPIGRTPERCKVYRQRSRARVAHMRLLHATAGAIGVQP